MSLRVKTLVSLSLVVVMTAVSFYLVARAVVMAGFIEIEQADVRDDVTRALEAVAVELDSLDASVADWATWDDTYSFIDSGSQAYIDSNLVFNSFKNNRVNVMLFVDRSGRVVYGASYDLSTGEQTDVPAGLLGRLSAQDVLVGHRSTDSGVQGLLSLPGKTALVASRPIVTSAGEGPVKGAVIWVRYLGADVVQRLKETTKLSLDLVHYNDALAPEDFQVARSLLSAESPLVVRALGTGSIAGYALMSDIDGAPALVLRVELSRHILAQAATTLYYFLLAMLGVGLLGMGMVVLLLEKGVLARVARLNRAVAAIGAGGQLSQRVPVKGSDELDRLATSVNDMLEGLEKAQAEHLRAERESRERKRLEAVRQVSLAVVGAVDLESVSALAAESTVTALDLDLGIIWHLDQESGDLLLLAHYGASPALAEDLRRNSRLKLGQGIAGKVAEAGRPLFFDTLPADSAVLYPEALRLGYVSFVGIPLRVKEKVVGAISCGSLRRRTFTGEDVNMLVIVGNMVGMAISDAHLFNLVEAGKKDWERTFDSMSDGVAVIDTGHRIVRANWALARMFDTHPRALVGRSCHEMVHGLEGPVEDCVLKRCVIMKAPCEVTARESGPGRRWLYLRADPVLGPDGEVQGAIHTFRDITVEKRRQEDLQRVYRLSQALSGSLDLDAVLNVTVQHVLGSFPEARGVTTGIALCDDTGLLLTVVAAAGESGPGAVGLRVPVSDIPEDVRGRVFRERRAVVLADLDRAPQALKERPGFSQHRALVQAPMVAGDRVIGVLFVASAEPGPVSSEDTALVENFAREAALAVESARLYGRTDTALRRRVNELETLTSVLEAATGGLSLERTVAHALGKAAAALGVDMAGAFLLDEGKLKLRSEYHASASAPSHEGFEMDVSWLPLHSKVMQAGRPQVVEDMGALPPGPGRDLPVSLGLRSSLVVPLSLGGRAMGTIDFGSTQGPRRFSAEEISLAQAVARHLVSIIENARLHERTESERSTLESIVASMGEGLVVTDEAGKTLYLNRAAEELWSMDARDVVGKPVGVYLDLLASRIVEPRDWRQQIIQEFGRGADRGKSHISVKTANGKEVESTLFVVEREGRRIGTGAVLRDVTREREVDRMKSEFIAVASHELRTPMTAVYGFAELLLTRATGLSPREQDWVQTIHRESKRLADIVDDLLNVSRIEAGRLSLNIQVVALPALLWQVLEQFKAGHPSHRLQSEPAGSLPPVKADPDKLGRVLYNLVDNAVKYSPGGGAVSVGARLEEDGKSVVVSVSDQGIGIPADEMPKLFGRFHRVQQPEVVGLRGTGLGLYISRSLVEMMGGRIWAESTPGKGSTFSFTLPVADDAVELQAP